MKTKKLWNLLAGAALLLAGLAGVAGRVVLRQGVPDGFWEAFPEAKVRFDAMGIPTVEAAGWDAALTTEGYLVASERLWQMDLIRRKAGGRLAEWFGEPAFAHDAAVQSEDRIGVAKAAADALPDDEKRQCAAYADGVNRFISEQRGRWGLEYALLRAEPEPWACADSILVELEMAETLTSTAEVEGAQWAWRKNLSPAWRAFLFPDQHPWNQPLFGATDHAAPPLPPEREWIAKAPLDAAPKERSGAVFRDLPAIGSNNWAWRGATGRFLANDPHLGNGVPDIWYVLRLKVAADDWAVGTAIPGIPGLVLGMNPALAWSFTNTGEDVDDYLEETLSPDGKEYEAKPGDWAPVIEKTFAIKVKGEAARSVTARFTERGPLAKRAHLGDGVYSRQWLPFMSGALRLPAVAMMRARSLAELDQALDDLKAPAQNVLAMDWEGTILYRTTGTGPMRRVSGEVPRKAFEGAWFGREPSARRPRLVFPAKVPETAYVATANQRIWTQGLGGHNWYADDRVDRIRTVLASRPDFTRADMEKLHHDVTGRFRAELLAWVLARSGEDVPGWKGWDGDARANPRAFTDSALVEGELSEVLLGRVRDAFLKGADREVAFEGHDRRATLLAVIGAPGDAGLAPFGLTAAAVAQHLVRVVTAKRDGVPLHPRGNLWKGQHPFVGRVPVVGDFFKVAEFEQWGASDLVAAEVPRHGPSMRIVWDLGKPWESTWAFPVGQSGHVTSAHFKDFQPLWIAGKTAPVFPDGAEGWSFRARPK